MAASATVRPLSAYSSVGLSAMSTARFRSLLSLAVVFGLGVLVGQARLVGTEARPAVAQEETPDNFKVDQLDIATQTQLKSAYDSVKGASSALAGEGRVTDALRTPNALGVTCGGIDALKDLEEGRGVDPETFAGLYAGFANENVIPKLGRDDQGRVTYDGNVVRLYSPERLKRLFQRRLTIRDLNND